MSIEKPLNMVIHTAHLFDIGEKHGKSDDKLGTRKLELASYLLSPVMRIAIKQTSCRQQLCQGGKAGPVGRIGSGDSDASPSGAEEGNWELWDVWQHLTRAVVKKEEKRLSSATTYHPHHISPLAAKPGQS